MERQSNLECYIFLRYQLQRNGLVKPILHELIAET